MKKISLKNVESTLSRKEMRAISGGYSRLYCWYHTELNIPFGIHNSHGSYSACRRA